jgi:hypothetical protein
MVTAGHHGPVWDQILDLLRQASDPLFGVMHGVDGKGALKEGAIFFSYFATRLWPRMSSSGPELQYHVEPQPKQLTCRSQTQSAGSTFDSEQPADQSVR